MPNDPPSENGKPKKPEPEPSLRERLGGMNEYYETNSFDRPATREASMNYTPPGVEPNEN